MSKAKTISITISSFAIYWTAIIGMAIAIFAPQLSTPIVQNVTAFAKVLTVMSVIFVALALSFSTLIYMAIAEDLRKDIDLKKIPELSICNGSLLGNFIKRRISDLTHICLIAGFIATGHIFWSIVLSISIITIVSSRYYLLKNSKALTSPENSQNI